MAQASKIYVNADSGQFADIKFVDYIQFNGNQYIDTGFIPNNNTKVEIGVEVTSQTNCYLYGVRGSVDAAFSLANINYGAFFLSYKYLEIGYGSKTTNSSSLVPNLSAGTQQTVTHDKDKVYIDATLKYTFTNVKNFTCTYTLWIGARRTGTSDFSPQSTCDFKLYSFKIWDNGTLVRDYRPCYKQSTGQVCLYENVERELVYHTGTQPLSKGNDIQTPADIQPLPLWKEIKKVYVNHIKPLPSNVNLVEYIQTTGKQYLDTGYNPNTNTKLEMCLEKIETADWSGKYVFGIQNSEYNSGFSVYNDQSFRRIMVSLDGYVHSITPDMGLGETHTFLIDKTKLYYDGVLDYDFGNRTYNYNTSLWVFAAKMLNNPSFVDRDGFGCKLFYLRIWDNDTLVREYYPCRNSVTGAVGLWENVSGEVVLHTGSEPFISGNELSPSDQIDTLRAWIPIDTLPSVKTNGTW